jgi:hypothetical protein
MSVEPKESPKTYQDVKANIRWYAIFASAGVALFLYSSLLPETHRKWIESFVSKLSDSKVVGLVGAGALVVGAFSLVSWILVFVFEIHDKIYDRYFIRWRHFYDLDFILPTLTRPFGRNLDSSFFAVAAKDPYQVMKPFYHFAADGEHDHKITENLILRFYESVTKYWLTQVNELLVLAALVVDFSYFFVYRRLGLDLGTVCVTGFILVVCFALNRLLARLFLRSVRQATLDEIEDIQGRYLAELEHQLQLLHTKLNLKWQP